MPRLQRYQSAPVGTAARDLRTAGLTVRQAFDPGGRPRFPLFGAAVGIPQKRDDSLRALQSLQVLLHGP